MTNIQSLVAILIYSIILVYTGFNWGYTDAQWEYSRPSKYRCHEGVVYRSSASYWEKTNTPCKPLDDIK